MPVDRERRLAELFDAHHSAVLAYVARRADIESARDLAADVFVVACRRLDDLPAGNERAWLLVTARNITNDHNRSVLRRGDKERRYADVNAPLDGDGQFADRVADSHLVMAAIQVLSEADRELLTLVAWDGLTLLEAARCLGCSAATARVRWLRARRRFEAALAAADPPVAGADGRIPAFPVPAERTAPQ